MTSRRPSITAARQNVRLARLAVARDYRPGRPASLDPDELPILAVVAAADHLLELARLLRMQAPPEEDPAARRLVVIAGAVATAITSDVQSGTSDATAELYLAITAYQRRRNE